MDRGRKRPEVAEQWPADKRACSTSEFRLATADAAASSSLHSLPPPSSSEITDCDMDSSSSGRGGGDSAYGSRESEDDPYHPMARATCFASRGKFPKILSALDCGDADASVQLASLTELCETLSFCMEDSLGHFPMDTALPVLVRLAGSEGNPDIMLLAIRAVTYLCDLMPRSADSIVRHGGLPVLCARLLSIEYLDVAEQSLQALEKISRKQPVPCLQAGVIMAVLGFIDFFSTRVQRVALSTVANVLSLLAVLIFCLFSWLGAYFSAAKAHELMKKYLMDVCMKLSSKSFTILKELSSSIKSMRSTSSSCNALKVKEIKQRRR
ncbi:E3 ubiquitin-protein ligase UPL4 [Platanthera guangdongensis]|uniref:HECT-type E3 ubiquitin transferase n=1 Tax=Platanthera guangdongensis TaxID=2320717 RepID=A0ABR2MCB3_9ASPA